MDKPNILVIMSDEHDPAVTGCYGDPIVQTPNLDRLAAAGVTFDAWGRHVASHPIFASAFHATNPPYPEQHPRARVHGGPDRHHGLGQIRALSERGAPLRKN